jgi:hypothetical protein
MVLEKVRKSGDGGFAERVEEMVQMEPGLSS